MNKTILLACCDFLILATLALIPLKSRPVEKSDNSIAESSEFHVDGESLETDMTEVLSNIQVQALKEELEQTNKELAQKDELNKHQSEKLASKDKQIASLNSELKRYSRPVYQTVQQNRWQINVAMKEDDSFNPDLFKTDFFTCAIEINSRVFLAAEFNRLGFSWSEIINDGNIAILNINIARTGENPWSTVCSQPLISMNQDPGLCLIPAPANRVYDPLKVIPYKQLPMNLENLYAAKCDGRLIKIKNASIIPNQPEWLTINEERFLGHPDKVEKGDVIVTSQGTVVGIITQAQRTGNENRLKCFILSKLDLSAKIDIPITKKTTSPYYNEFVSQSRLIAQRIKSTER